MVFRKLFLRALTACMALGLASVTSLAQTSVARIQPSVPVVAEDISCSPDDPATFSPGPAPEAKATNASLMAANVKPAQVAVAQVAVATIQPTAASLASLALTKFQPLLMAAIDQRLGARYSWGATGPNRY